MTTNEDSEDFGVYLIRRQDQKKWLAEANGGSEVAKLVLWAASNWIKDMVIEHFACSCCDRLFSPGDVPRAFIVLIPTVRDPEKVEAKASAVCSECSAHDDRWLIDQAIHRQGLSPATARPGDQIH
jgi:hypothetical protein